MHGFRLNKETNIKEIGSITRLFEHRKTGARLLALENDDDNKVFSITFRTPPKDSTGLPHIIEHSVLCGSRKFPSKEPFVELLKGSLNTFLNAMTAPDKTMYPVASKNEKDFMNLTDVYLDAVLFPKLLDIPEILMQEGWRYELNDKSGELIFNGVVYNEMKGAYSSPESTLRRKIQIRMFPNTPYGVDSGGNPDDIPNLTQEQFTAFHKRYYHPSNSYIYLYGNGNLEKQLQFIDEEYLQHFDRLKVDSVISTQKPFDKTREFVEEYPISHNEVEKDKTYLSMNFAVGKSIDAEQCLAFEILSQILLGTPSAPLKKALLDVRIGKDVWGTYGSYLLQPLFSIVVKNSNEDSRERFQEIISETLQELIENGIDKKLVEASINITEFSLREAEGYGEPKGLIYNRMSLKSWIHDVDPTLHLCYDPLLVKIKTALTTNYFEELINKYLLNNHHSGILILRPHKGLVEKREEQTRERLNKYKAGLSAEEISEITKRVKSLKKRQQTPDSAEDLEKIPLLTLKDINPEAEELPLVEKRIDGVKVLSHPMSTNKIGYLNLYFNTTSVPQELISYIPLLANILGKIGTDKYDYGEISNEINIYTGGIEYTAQAFSAKDTDEIFHPVFLVKSKALMDKLPKLLELLTEILVHTELDDRKRLKEIIQETKSRLEMVISFRAGAFAINRMFSCFSPYGKYNELIDGLSYYRFICNLEENFSDRAAEYIQNLRETARLTFNKSNLLISFTSPEEDFTSLKRNLPVLVAQLSTEQLKKINYHFDFSRENEGLLTPSNVQYVVKGYNFRQMGYDYSGKMQVLIKIFDTDYLWNRIRVLGGAYGGWPRLSRNGDIFFASFRDPNLNETLRVYDQSDKYIRKFDVSEREMTKYIIGTISDLDYPLTPSMKGTRATARYISHITQDEIQSERNEALNTNPENIRDLADLVAEAMKQNYYCVIGNESKIRENQNLFSKLINVFD